MNHRLSRREALLALGALSLSAAGCRSMSHRHPPMTATSTPFGTLPDGRTADLFTLTNGHGTVLKFTNYGLTVTELHTADRDGKLGNVVLGFDNFPRYLRGHPFFGCIAGRIANRIAGARFTLDGREYRLVANNGRNHIHGGTVGFDKRLWTAAAPVITPDAASVELTYMSPDGEEGYPGTLRVMVRYTLTQDDEWRIDYRAETDAPTILNLTNHSYFNLAGRGDVLNHAVEIASDQFTEVDDELIPSGKILPVAGTPLDFRQPTAIGARGMNTGLKPSGYDHNFILRQGGGKLGLAARAYDPVSGRTMDCLTTEPAVQLWTMNFDPGTDLVCTGGFQVPKHGGFCLETQHYPDSIHHPHFPTTELRPGQVFASTTAYRFGVRR
jgi:aldose 1-epimerase